MKLPSLCACSNSPAGLMCFGGLGTQRVSSGKLLLQIKALESESKPGPTLFTCQRHRCADEALSELLWLSSYLSATKEK